jgi:hypothetical protein
VADLIIKIKGNSTQAQAALKKAGVSFDKLDSKTKTSSASFSKLKNVAKAALVGVIAVGLKKAVALASQFEEANAKFGTVFRGHSKEANKMRDELVKSYGQSTTAATKMLGNMQDFLVPMGLVRGEATKLSGDVLKLAADLGSFNKVPTTEVVQAMQSALSGIAMPMKRFGVDVTEAGLKQQLLAEGINRSVKSLSRAEKAQLIYRKMMADSGDAIGDYNRTSDSFANTLVRLKNRGEDVALSLGQNLLKSLGPSLNQFDKFIQSEEGMRNIQNAAKGIATAFLIIQSVVVTLWNAIQMLVDGLVFGFKVATESVTNFFRAILRKEPINIFNENWNQVKENMVKNAGDIKDSWVNTAGNITEIWKQASDAQIEGTKRVVDDAKDAALQRELADKQAVESAKKAHKESMNAWKKRIGIVKQYAQVFSSIASGLVQIEQNKLDKIDKADTEAKMKQAKKIRNMMVFEKATKMAGAAIDTAAAILKTMASVPFPVNIPLAIAQGVAGAVQMGVIASTPIPSVADLAAPHGADFVTDGPTNMTVGDNPSGRERVTVTPEEEAGGNDNIFYIDQVIIQTDSPEDFGRQMQEFGIRTARRA